MITAMVISTLAAGAILATYLAGRSTNRREAERFRELVSSPVNGMIADLTRVRVTALVALDEDMLIELRPAAPRHLVDEPVTWLYSPTNLAAIISLARWRDAGAIVDLRRQTHGVLLRDDHAVVRLTRARADLSI